MNNDQTSHSRTMSPKANWQKGIAYLEIQEIQIKIQTLLWTPHDCLERVEIREDYWKGLRGGGIDEEEIRRKISKEE